MASRRDAQAPTARVAAPSRKRATRSASRDVEVPPSTKPVSRSTRRAREESAQSDVSSSAPIATGARRSARNVVPVEELAPVTEDIDEADADETLADPRASVGRFSNISGTTAISSGTLGDAATIDPQPMLETVEELYQGSEKFLSSFAAKLDNTDKIATAYSELHKAGTSQSRIFNSYKNRFHAALDNFLVSEHEYVSYNIVARALFGVQEVEVGQIAKQGLAAVLYKANLAVLLRNFLTFKPDADQERIWTALRELDRRFPIWLLAFVSERVPNNSKLAGISALQTQSFELAAEIRVQLAVLALKREASRNKEDGEAFDPVGVLEAVFFSQPDEDAEQEELRGWETAWFEQYGEDAEQGEMPQALKAALLEKFEELQSIVEENLGKPLNLDKLSSNFPWMKFVTMLISWSRARNAEINEFVTGMHGIDSIAQAIEESHNPPIAENVLPEPQVPAAPKVKALRKAGGRSSFDSAAIALFKAFTEDGAPTQQNSSDFAAPARTSQANPQPLVDQQEDEWRPPPNGNDDIPDELVDEPGEVPASTFTARARAAQQIQNKENLRKIGSTASRTSFIDRQAGAERVEFGEGFEDSQQASASAHPKASGALDAHAHLSSARQPGPSSSLVGRSVTKRRYEEMAEDEDDCPSEDEGFQEDTRSVNIQQQRQSAPVRKKARFRDGSNASTSMELARHRPSWGERAGLVNARSEQNEDDDEDEGRLPASRLYDHTPVNRLARQFIATQPKQRRQKNPWSPEEEARLIKLQELHPNAWRYMQDHFAERTNVDIKDKARNMKMDYIKAGIRPLPANFDQVSLGARIEEELRNRGCEW